MHIEQPCSKKLGTLTVQGDETGDWQELSYEVDEAEGVQVQWFNINGKGKNLFEVDWVRFEKSFA